MDISEQLKTVIGKESVNSFAKKCDISESVIRSYLKGISVPSLDKALQIAKVGQVSLDWLATGEGRQSPTPEQTNSGYQITFDIVVECSKALHEWLKKDKSTLEPEDTAYITALLCEVYEEQGKIDTKFIDRLMKLKGNMR